MLVQHASQSDPFRTGADGVYESIVVLASAGYDETSAKTIAVTQQRAQEKGRPDYLRPKHGRGESEREFLAFGIVHLVVVICLVLSGHTGVVVTVCQPDTLWVGLVR